MSIKINYNNKTIEYKIYENRETKAYFVKISEETRIPIEIVKDALEEQFNIKIAKYGKAMQREYTDNHFLNEPNKPYYYYYFTPENNERS